MKLRATDRALLTLVRAGLWEQAPDDPDALRLDESRWREVYDAAKAQTVVGLVWRGIDHIEDESLMPPKSVLDKMAVKVSEIEAHSATASKLTDQLLDLLKRRGLHPVLLKGKSSAALYEHPELRESGDIDIYLPKGEFSRAIPKGSEKESDGAVTYELKGIQVEHHRRLVDVSSRRNIKFIDTLIDREGADSTLLQMLILDTHVMKHCIGRGVGLRQCCDFARARKVLDYDRPSFDAACEVLGISEWTSVFEELCDHYLGQQCPEGKCSAKCWKLLERVLTDGNFGRSTTKAEASAWRTLRAFCSHFGFSLKLAPRETWATIFSLAGGRLSR